MRRVFGVLAGLAALGSVLVAAPTADAATTKLKVIGSVSCPSGKPVVGAWLHSSGGGSTWLDWIAYPGASTVAKISKTISTKLPTTLKVDVGCGGTAKKWASPTNLGPSLKVKAGKTTAIYNVSCNGKGACAGFKLVKDPRGPSYNWFAKSQCTHRAANFWKQMTGYWPNWHGSDGRTGNAHQWDDRAKAFGWSVGNWPRPDSLVVWQADMVGGGAGHVGYVKDVRRTSKGKLEMYVQDRNMDNSGGDRNTWVPYEKGMRFILVPSRAK